MELQKIKHQIQLEYLKGLVQECHSSGMTKKAWCEANRINEQTYNALRIYDSKKTSVKEYFLAFKRLKKFTRRLYIDRTRWAGSSFRPD